MRVLVPAPMFCPAGVSQSPCVTDEFPVDFVRRGDIGAPFPLTNGSSSTSRRLAKPAARSPSPTRLLPLLDTIKPSELPPLCPWRLPLPLYDGRGSSSPSPTPDRSSDSHLVWCFLVSSRTVEYREDPGRRGETCTLLGRLEREPRGDAGELRSGCR